MAALNDFLAAQDAHWTQITSELRQGHKTSHWIWYVFPQLECLGRSQTARHYGIANLAEAEAYLSHPILRARLAEASLLLLHQPETDPVRILGSIDALKLRSSMTLFFSGQRRACRVLDRFYQGKRCQKTLSALGLS
ncbi:DUF1810 domain-containing protein [Citreicella sp. C3M06]|uniref:DUF1810 domain-containing protein n=1 Tax=Citreicella sp. C3M06 TaxID=2841564 RepID=UPI001C09AC51|nr:DUF1810 domain-containing protein [Citreicella sp. C3M06]MBU2960653.1 DUF1810 domain-containing protein [Citreicella sp. C3M06]